VVRQGIQHEMDDLAITAMQDSIGGAASSLGLTSSRLKRTAENELDYDHLIEQMIEKTATDLDQNYRFGMPAHDWQSIAHKVLADRITARDPGNKPSSGDRIPFVYINTNNKHALQGEKIETPTYILENGLKIDYSFYITNQIMKPTQQLFSLVLEKIWEMQNKRSKILKFRKEVDALRKKTDPEKFDDKLNDLKDKEIKVLLFDEYLRETNNEKQGNQSLTKYFKAK
jgi:hypothetical protein